MRQKRIFGFLAVIILLGSPASSYAQKNKAEKQSDNYLESIIVTAQKREESAQKTPISLVTFDATAQEDRMIENVEELVTFVPNMSSFDTTVLGENVITTRGITASATTRSTSTAMYVDGVPVISSFGFVSDLFDAERIEILRGPQGTLYGKSTQAGAVNILTVKPTEQFMVKLTGQGEYPFSDNDYDELSGGISALASGPLVDNTLSFSLSGRFDHKGGFIENRTTGEKEQTLDGYYGGGKLHWTPADSLEVTFIFSGKALRQNGNNANRAGATNRIVYSDLTSWQDVDGNMQAINARYDISDKASLTSISTRSKLKLLGEIDFDFSNMKLMHGMAASESEILSQELRLNLSHGAWDWLFGIYLDHQEIDYSAKIDSMNPMYKSGLSTNLKGKSYAGYFDTGYQINNQLKLLAGLRYAWQQYEFGSTMLSGNHDEDWTNLSPKFGLQYEFASHLTGYATISEGYRPGGFNDRAINPKYYKYDPETLWSYEVGLKSTLLNNRLIINGAIFYMDISDMQVEENITLTEYYLTNAASATSVGGEIDFTAILGDGLRLYGGIGIGKAEFDKFHDARGNYDGNKLPYAPEYTYNIGLQYRSTTGFYIGGNVTGYGKTYFDKDNFACRNNYALVNMKIGYETENFDIYLYGKNIFDRQYDVKNWMGMDVYSEPGKAGLQLVWRF